MRVCLITPGQPSNNPRLVKEADALTEAGHQVHVVCTDSGLWPTKTDRELLAARQWTCEYVGGRPATEPLKHRWTRIRYGVARRIADTVPVAAPLLGTALLSRAAPEIAVAAERRSADLYIAHHATLLPIAVRTANRMGARVGYDAEDFYSGLSPLRNGPSSEDRRIESIERKWLISCDFVTASAPAIADEYVHRYGIERPVPVLNTFPLSQCPHEFRTTDLSQNLRLYWFSQCIGANRGLEDVVCAMGLLKGLGTELHLRGSWQTGYQARLMALATQNEVSRQIHVHPHAPPDEMIRLAAQYDVGLSVEQSISRNDALCLSNKIFTYLLAGNAVIGTRTPAQKNLISSLGAAGVSYECGNVSSLAAQLSQWHQDRTALNHARRCAWDWGQRRYNWDLEKHNLLNAVASSRLRRAMTCAQS
jgi:glycosyltransferase involved in cell wall biosynthesis